MNKRDREQLRSSISKDLVRGQAASSPTKELLRQYAPLEGILTTPCPDASPRSVPPAPDIKENHHQRPEKAETGSDPVENHSRAAAPRERQEPAREHFALVCAAYEKATGNRWNKADSEAYYENGIEKLPVEKAISALEAVARRTPAKINSFNYFVRELVSLRKPSNRAWQKKQLEKIVRRIRDSTVGSANSSWTDFVEDVKCACAREAVPFDHDVFNELVT